MRMIADSLLNENTSGSKWTVFNTVGMVGLPVLLLAMIYTANYTLLYAVIGLSLLFLNKPEVLFPTYYAASLSSSFSVIGDGVSAARYLSLIMILSSLLCVNKGVLKSKDLVVFVIVVVFTFLSTVLGYDGKITFFFVMLQNLLVFFLFSLCVKVDYEKLIYGLVFVSFLVVLLLFLQARNAGAFMFMERYNDDDSINANNLAMMIAQCSAFSIAYALFGKKNLIRILCVGISIATVLLVLATGSRTSLIAISMALIIGIFFRYGQSNIFLKVVIVLAVTFAFLKASQSIMDSGSQVLNRFSYENIAEDGGAGRLTDLTIIVTKIMPDHLLFGSGIGGSNMKALGREYGLPNLSHNIIIDPLSQMGVIGYIIYLFLLIPIISKCKTIIRYRNVSYLPLFAFLALITAIINGLGETVFYEKFFWNDLGLCVLAFNIYYTNGKIQKLS